MSANQENMQNVHLEGEISMVHRHQHPAGHSIGLGLADSSAQCNLTEEEFEARLRRSYRVYEERLEQVRADYDYVVGEYKRENLRRKGREEELLQEQDAMKRELDAMKRTIEQEGESRQELQKTKLQLDELQQALTRADESLKRSTQSKATPLTVEHLQSILERLNVGEDIDQSQSSPGTNSSLGGQVASATRNCLQTVRQMIEECLNKWQTMVLQQQRHEGTTAQLEHFRARCDTLSDENRSLTSKLETENRTVESFGKEGREYQRRISEMETTCSELRQKEREALEQLKDITVSHNLQQEVMETAIDQLRREVEVAQNEATDAACQRQRIEHQVDGLSRTIADLKGQLEERIAENCSLNTDLEKRSGDLAKAIDARRRMELELNDASATTQTRIRDLQHELQSVSARREEQESQYESQIRQLRLEQDQMRIRNDTFQRQLAAITSTYNHMFAATTTDASD